MDPKINDGGPAFPLVPCPGCDNSHKSVHEFSGTSLRALAALTIAAAREARTDYEAPVLDCDVRKVEDPKDGITYYYRHQSGHWYPFNDTRHLANAYDKTPHELVVSYEHMFWRRAMESADAFIAALEARP